ncbi:MAG: metal-dependent hydrolase [Terriglobia bacterium]
MDNVTHTLTGIALSQAGLRRKTRFALLALIVGSNLPDIDVIASGGGIGYLKYHRGITHSLVGLTGLAAILAVGIWLYGRRASPRKNAPPLNLKWLFIVCWIATACHVLMDYTNSYGVRPFLPFSGHWFALDLMPLVGPYLLLVLIVGLAVPAILRLAGAEAGWEKTGAALAKNGAIFSLCAMLGIWGLRGLSRSRALEMLNSHTYGQENPSRTGAFPRVLSPFEWTGVVETGRADYVLRVNSLATDVNVRNAEALLKPEPSAGLRAARKTPAARIFLQFARFPWAMILRTEKGYEVYLRDLRFASPGSGRWGFVLRIFLTASLRVREESFVFSMKKPFE